MNGCMQNMEVDVARETKTQRLAPREEQARQAQEQQERLAYHASLMETLQAACEDNFELTVEERELLGV